MASHINIYSAAGFISSWTANSGAPNKLLAWNTGSGTANALTMNLVLGSAQNMTGVFYSPNAPINLSANTLSGTGLIEGQQVHLDATNINWSGNGPAAVSPGTSTVVTSTTTTPVTTTATISTTGTTTTTGTTSTTTTGASNLSG